MEREIGRAHPLRIRLRKRQQDSIVGTRDPRLCLQPRAQNRPNLLAGFSESPPHTQLICGGRMAHSGFRFAGHRRPGDRGPHRPATAHFTPAGTAHHSAAANSGVTLTRSLCRRDFTHALDLVQHAEDTSADALSTSRRELTSTGGRYGAGVRRSLTVVARSGAWCRILFPGSWRAVTLVTARHEPHVVPPQNRRSIVGAMFPSRASHVNVSPQLL